MNSDLIKQLADLAGTVPIHERPKDRALIGTDNIAKFAELIVRECAELMPQDDLYKMVLRHFGE